MIKVLYLSYDGLTDPLGQSQILPYLCGLSNEYSITIISFEKKNRYEIEKDLIVSFCKKNSIEWIPLVYHKDPPVISTIYDLWRLRRMAARLHQHRCFKIVHCRSYLTALVGLWMKNKYGTKFIFDMRGFWADERVEGGLWDLKNPLYNSIYKYFKKKENVLVNNADEIITLTKSAAQEIQSWNVDTDISVIPCCVDLNIFDRRLLNKNDLLKIRQSLEIADDTFVLLYLGSIGTWYLYKEMVDFFDELKREIPGAKFLWITPDVRKVEDRSDFIVLSARRNQVPQYISLSNASICFIKPSFSKKGSSATKIGEVMAMGLQVITNSGWGDVAYMNLPEQLVIKSFDSTSYSKAIKFLQSNLETSTPLKFDLSLKDGISRYKSVYAKLGEL